MCLVLWNRGIPSFVLCLYINLISQKSVLQFNWLLAAWKNWGVFSIRPNLNPYHEVIKEIRIPQKCPNTSGCEKWFLAYKRQLEFTAWGPHLVSGLHVTIGGCTQNAPWGGVASRCHSSILWHFCQVFVEGSPDEHVMVSLPSFQFKPFCNRLRT